MSLSCNEVCSCLRRVLPTDLRQLGLVGLGQLVSLLLVATNASSAVLAKRGLEAPMLQSFFNYLLLALVYGTPMFYRFYTQRSASIVRENTGLVTPKLATLFFLFALADVEANFLIVKAYQYASITSVTLLDCFTIPCVVCLSFCFLGARYG
eukprot:CAMPEP_0181325916 /NCGR_PEP_ID=MMETSP1101-20121128/21199_1 /TAXON_ID=46948 /ORGANISM="Rhodomonas abbreviata, Strain Caron Lab Isolate" /LENGTH=151 /DNA_ID=CAMNT_0023434293 /DNA_START=72 /DNA_END=524 /DNA_ORIENTATION=-